MLVAWIVYNSICTSVRTYFFGVDSYQLGIRTLHFLSVVYRSGFKRHKYIFFNNYLCPSVGFRGKRDFVRRSVGKATKDKRASLLMDVVILVYFDH